jgi:hypothetical protein
MMIITRNWQPAIENDHVNRSSRSSGNGNGNGKRNGSTASRRIEIESCTRDVSLQPCRFWRAKRRCALKIRRRVGSQNSAHAIGAQFRQSTLVQLINRTSKQTNKQSSMQESNQEIAVLKKAPTRSSSQRGKDWRAKQVRLKPEEFLAKEAERKRIERAKQKDTSLAALSMVMKSQEKESKQLHRARTGLVKLLFVDKAETEDEDAIVESIDKPIDKRDAELQRLRAELAKVTKELEEKDKVRLEPVGQGYGLENRYISYRANAKKRGREIDNNEEAQDCSCSRSGCGAYDADYDFGYETDSFELNCGPGERYEHWTRERWAATHADDYVPCRGRGYPAPDRGYTEPGRGYALDRVRFGCPTSYGTYGAGWLSAEQERKAEEARDGSYGGPPEKRDGSYGGPSEEARDGSDGGPPEEKRAHRDSA